MPADSLSAASTAPDAPEAPNDADLQLHSLITNRTASAVRVKTRTCAGQQECPVWCSCMCHRQSTYQQPMWARSLLGNLFVGYTGLPIVTPRCTETTCRRQSGVFIEATYSFPSWFLDRIILLQGRSFSPVGPELYLRTPRVTTLDLRLWAPLQDGRIDVFQERIARGMGTAQDISVDGHSFLHVSYFLDYALAFRALGRIRY